MISVTKHFSSNFILIYNVPSISIYLLFTFTLVFDCFCFCFFKELATSPQWAPNSSQYDSPWNCGIFVVRKHCIQQRMFRVALAFMQWFSFSIAHPAVPPHCEQQKYLQKRLNESECQTHPSSKRPEIPHWRLVSASNINIYGSMVLADLNSTLFPSIFNSKSQFSQLNLKFSKLE